jgi:aerobic carbon-monoxide dehydrogenase medium subunit
VYPAEFEYFAPRTIDEAVQLLERFGDEAKILAGGQSLLPMMKLRIASPRCLIDINRVDGLNGLRPDGDRLVIGALCRHAEIAASAIVREQMPLLRDAANLTADVQVRNRGTVAGSIAHADPAGDWPAALAALDTEVTIRGRAGTRQVPLSDFIIDAYTTQLATGEMVIGLSVGIRPKPSGGAYVKFERRAGDFAVASLGVQLDLEGDRCRNVAVSLGALGATPIRARAAEELLDGQMPTPDVLRDAQNLVIEAAQPFDDTRGSAKYKRHLAGVLFRRAFAAAFDRARGLDAGTIHM